MSLPVPPVRRTVESFSSDASIVTTLVILAAETGALSIDTKFASFNVAVTASVDVYNAYVKDSILLMFE